MKQFLELVKRELKNNRKINYNPSTFSKISKIFTKIFLYFIFFIVESVVFRTVIKLFAGNMLEKEFLILFLILLFIIQLIMILVGLVKSLNNSNENAEILTLPIRQEKIFFSKLLIMFIKQFAVAILVGAPVLINYALITNQTLGFIFCIIPCMLFNTIFAMGIAVILSVLLLNIVNVITNRFFIVMILYLIIILVGFSLYIDLLKSLLLFFQTENYAGLMSIEFIYIIQDVCSYMYLFVLLKNILIGQQIISSLIILLTFSLGILAVIKIFAKHLYFKILRNSLIKEPKFSERKTRFKNRSVKTALVVKEAKTIFRSSNYAFSFFVVSLSTPALVYSCNSLISELGLKIAGSIIYPALAILILSLFMTIVSSFSATSITRESKNFPATKTYPVPYKEQINAKLCLYLLVEIPALLVSLAVLYFSGFIGVIDFIMIFLIVLSLTYANITRGINIDIKKPQFNYLNNNENLQNNYNISKNVAYGSLICTILSALSIGLLFIIGRNLLYVIILTFSFSYALLKHYSLYRNLNKKYNSIEY